MKIDLTLNLPTLLTLLGVLATVVYRFARVETRVDNLDQRVTRHEELDEERAVRIDERLTSLATARPARATK